MRPPWSLLCGGLLPGGLGGPVLGEQVLVRRGGPPGRHHLSAAPVLCSALIGPQAPPVSAPRPALHVRHQPLRRPERYCHGVGWCVQGLGGLRWPCAIAQSLLSPWGAGTGQGRGRERAAPAAGGPAKGGEGWDTPCSEDTTEAHRASAACRCQTARGPGPPASA